MKKVFAISGSIRQDSGNWKILQLISELYKEKLSIEIYTDLPSLPHFDPNLQGEEIPQIVAAFYDKISDADGVVICTPEYVFSPPAILKNALEWTVAHTIFSYKPTAMIVASSAGENTFESLSLIMKTLLQKDIPENQKLLIRGVRAKVGSEGRADDNLTLKLKQVIDSLILEMNITN